MCPLPNTCTLYINYFSLWPSRLPFLHTWCSSCHPDLLIYWAFPLFQSAPIRIPWPLTALCTFSPTSEIYLDLWLISQHWNIQYSISGLLFIPCFFYLVTYVFCVLSRLDILSSSMTYPGSISCLLPDFLYQFLFLF